jgi:hypothetical protein
MGGVCVQTLLGEHVLLPESAIQAWQGHLRGPVLRSGDDGYGEARRVWNGMIDRKPALIVRCTGAADVIAAVNFAREHRLLVAVRGGGHNVAGTAVCDGGIVVDLSPMKGIRVDPVARTAWAQPGVLWGEFDHETQAFGLATPGGIVTHTGIAGLTLGGGIGWLMRKHGLTCDNLLAADVVTAAGQLLHASPQEHPDLFWGLCGGGGNFGIVTSFEYRLHPVGPQVLAGVLLHTAERAGEVLRFYRDYIAAVPDELTTIVNLRKAPPAPFLPPHLHGRPVVIIGVCYAGDIAAGERVLAPLRAFGAPLIDLIRPTAYTAHQGLFDASVPHGLRYYWKSEYLAALSDQAIDTLVAHAWQAPSPTSYTIMFQLGGPSNGRARRLRLSRTGARSMPSTSTGYGLIQMPPTNTSSGRETFGRRCAPFPPAGCMRTSSARRARTGSGRPMGPPSMPGWWPSRTPMIP